MSQSALHRKLALDTYNKIVHDKNQKSLELLESTIKRLQFEKSNVAEISLLYCLQSDYYFQNGSYNDAYNHVMDALKVDSDRKEVLQQLITIHTPQIIDKEGNNKSYSSNPYQNDEKAKEYCIKLSNLYPNDIEALYFASQCFSGLGLYNDSLRILKRAFSKTISSFKQNKNQSSNDSKQFVEEIKKKITQTYIDRYSNCPNDSHETIITYLIELIEWKYNDFNASNLQICIGEIWERIEYILSKHIETVNDVEDNNALETEWNKIWSLLYSIPSSIPLSATLINLIYDIFIINQRYHLGIEFFSRIITEYQTFNENMLTIHAKFEKYHMLYLNRAKLYKILRKREEMMEDIEEFNVRILCDQMEMETADEQNLLHYVFKDENEKPMIENEIQIKKRRESRLSNINISPMPKQYRDFHLTPKKNQPQSNFKRKAFPKRYSLNHIDHIYNDEKKESEEKREECFKLQLKNIELKNDLNRETLKSTECKKEIERLQQQIVKLTDNLCAAVNNQQDTSKEWNGEKQEADGYVGELKLKSEIVKRDGFIEELKMTNKTNKDMIKSLKRQLAILRDCKVKNGLNDVEEIKKKSMSSKICGFCLKVIKLVISLVVLIFIIILILGCL